MKHQGLYRKFKTNYPPFENPIFSRKDWWRTVLIVLIAVIIEPLVIYKHYRHVPFTLNYYMQQIEYFLSVSIPFVAFLIWAYHRENIRRNNGYVWVGKFEVINKQRSFLFSYLILTPGKNNKLKVDRSLFEKSRLGDIIIIRRDSYWQIEKLKKIKNISSRLTKVSTKNLQKPFSTTDLEHQ